MNTSNRHETTPALSSLVSPQRSSVSRKRLAFEGVLACVHVSAVACIVSTLIWDQQERGMGSVVKYNWSPVDDLASNVFFMPVGFVLYSFLPAGWLYWIGFLLMLTMRRREFLIISAIGAIWFGIVWPKHWGALLGI